MYFHVWSRCSCGLYIGAVYFHVLVTFVSAAYMIGALFLSVYGPNTNSVCLEQAVLDR